MLLYFTKYLVGFYVFKKKYAYMFSKPFGQLFFHIWTHIAFSSYDPINKFLILCIWKYIKFPNNENLNLICPIIYQFYLAIF